MRNQAVDQEVLHSEPLAEDKASAGMVQVDPSMAKDFQVEVEGSNQEASMANEVEMEGPKNILLQLVHHMISNTGRKRKDIRATMIDTTRKNRKSRRKKCI